METEPKIVFMGMDPSPFVQRRIEGEIEKLEKFFGRITACNVVIEAPGHHKAHGDLFSLSVHLSLPDGREVIANRNPPQDHAHEDPYVAIRDVFRAAKRQLQDQVRKLDGKTKTHEAPMFATVKSLVAEQDYGFLGTDDGAEIYFHRNAVLNDAFDSLEVGTRVNYVAELGENGLQASTVRISGKHKLS